MADSEHTTTLPGRTLETGNIDWHRVPGFLPLSIAHRAVIGAYELTAFDLPDLDRDEHARLVGWEIHTGPQYLALVGLGDAVTIDEAKAAAVAEVCRLLGVHHG